MRNKILYFCICSILTGVWLQLEFTFVAWGFGVCAVFWLATILLQYLEPAN